MSNLKRWGFSDLDNFFGELYKPLSLEKLGWDLAVDVFEEGDNIVAEMAVAGIDPKKIDVSVEDRTLKISGTREEKTEKKGKHFYKREIRSGSFERHISLPADVDLGKAKAECQDGMLRITLPKKSGKDSKVKIDVR